MNQNQESICLLLKECDGEVYMLSRFQNGIYALSQGKVDDINLEKIFSYKMDGFDVAGPADNELDKDLTELQFFGYIEISRAKYLNHKTNHDLITLLSRGYETANINEFLPKELDSIKKVAKILKENQSPSDLLNKFCKKWSKTAVEKISAPEFSL